MTEWYFAFGANVNPETLRRRGVEARESSPARLDGFRLVFDTPGIPGLEPAFASLVEADEHVWGVLYQLDAGALARLRSFEGEAYSEIEVEVCAGDTRIAARTFVTAGARRPRRPSRRYVRVIAAGARLHGLPAAWIKKLETHPQLYLPVVHELWGVVFVLLDRVRRVLVPPAKPRG
ncbi:MAG: gamma-glutamylcyclotransferase [Myxococcales bacterium]|nr:gamma-glutamylcyclotransferase [Myxococcales bacterium]